jgi:hypothetical protein
MARTRRRKPSRRQTARFATAVIDLAIRPRRRDDGDLLDARHWLNRRHHHGDGTHPCRAAHSKQPIWCGRRQKHRDTDFLNHIPPVFMEATDRHRQVESSRTSTSAGPISLGGGDSSGPTGLSNCLAKRERAAPPWSAHPMIGFTCLRRRKTASVRFSRRPR